MSTDKNRPEADAQQNPAPYRDPDGPESNTPAPAARRPDRRRKWLLLAAAAVVAGGVFAVRVTRRRTLALSGDPLPELTDGSRVFPVPADDLEPATPLAPLLAADEPERLAVMEPAEGATNVARGEHVTVRFNRPMVQGSQVGRPLTDPPILFDPPVRGTARWTSRSALSFEPDASVWNRTHESHLTLAPGMRSLANEAVEDDAERTVVFDGGARVASDRSPRRVVPGEPLRLVFDGLISPQMLGSQIMAYEVGGGRRALSFTLAPHGHDDEGRSLLDVRLARVLEPGAHVQIALAPMLFPDRYDDGPGVIDFELTPRPQIEGVGCPPGATDASQCTHTAVPGAVVDIADTLRVYSSAPLAALDPGTVRITPALPAQEITAVRNLLSIRGEWAPGQVYEVRIGDLRDDQGRALIATRALAVRSAGRTPEVQVARGRLTFERDALAEIRFAAVHVDRGVLGYAAVATGEEFAAARYPSAGGAWDRGFNWSRLPLQPIVPTSRANRWARGGFAWFDPTASRASSMAVVSFHPDMTNDAAGSAHSAFVQSTDLGITTRALENGVLVWVTSLATARPVVGANIAIATGAGASLASGHTNSEGMVWIPLVHHVFEDTLAIRAAHGDDRAITVIEPRSGAILPDALGLTPGAAPPADNAPVASVFTDRGAYRPGETVHAKIVARTVVGDTLRAVTRGPVRVRVSSPTGAAPLLETDRPLSAFGTADIEFPIEADGSLGEYLIEVYRPGITTRIGAGAVMVAEYRQPAFRVDLAAETANLAEGDAFRARVDAAYLFGAPAANARVRWSLARQPDSEVPPHWDGYTFAPVEAGSRSGTVDSGELTLDPHGNADIVTRIGLGATMRERSTIEVEVRDASGQSTTARRSFVTYPATYEVGIHNGPQWVEPGTVLDVDAVLVAHDGAVAAGRRIEARIVREGWHSYWEWSSHAHDDAAGSEGGYQARRAREQVAMQRCALTSGTAAVHCEFTPTRPGTYLLEAVSRDDAGRTAVASRRVYVAGPGEHPDRDPPGAPIAVTPVRRGWFVGERARVAFESPWPDAEVLFTVEREGVFHTERRHLEGGGSIFEFTVTRDMVPNAFVNVVLVRPRSAPPGAQIDTGAPDLRVGAAEITVRPQAAPLGVEIRLASPTVLPGAEVQVDVDVRDGEGHGIRSEVALYAVDEGTLRLTSYATPDPTAGLFPRRAPRFAVEDLRRSLVSRVEMPPLPGSSGDGPTADASRPVRDERERIEATPLWLPRLLTDGQGHARVSFHVPNRPTQYRVMAVAVDTGMQSGHATTSLTATRPVVLRPALPRSVTDGDRFEAAVFVHNAGTAPVDATLTTVVGASRRAAHRVHLEGGADARVGEWIDVRGVEPIDVRFEANAAGVGDAVISRVAVRPRGRWLQGQTLGAVQGSRDLTISMPPGTLEDTGELTMAVAVHPFVGLDAAVADLEALPYGGAEPTASAIIALASFATMTTAPHHGRSSVTELRARAEAALERLRVYQTSGGGFSFWSANGGSDPYLTAYASHAMQAMRRAGWTVPATMRERALVSLVSSVHNGEFGDYYPSPGHDSLAFALRVLTDAGRTDAARITAAYDQRERLTPFGLAQLAMAMQSSDRRRDALVLSATRRVLATRSDEVRDGTILRWYDTSTRTFAAVLEASARIEVAYSNAQRLASTLLRMRTGDGGATWGSSHEGSFAIDGLAAYARRFRQSGALAATVTLDGAIVQPIERRADSAWYRLPVSVIGHGSHRLQISSRTPAFYALAGRWAAPLGLADDIARGHVVAVHRVLETESGTRLEPGARVHLGELIRVRLFTYAESSPPPFVAIRDPLGGGFEAVDSGLDTSPRSSLDALLGMGQDDGAMDPRGHHAARSLDLITHRGFEPGAAIFHLDAMGAGLHEFTYGIRATTVGTFVVPPAQLEAMYAPDYVARSAVNTLVVEP